MLAKYNQYNQKTLKSLTINSCYKSRTFCYVYFSWMDSYIYNYLSNTWLLVWIQLNSTIFKLAITIKSIYEFL